MSTAKCRFLLGVMCLLACLDACAAQCAGEVGGVSLGKLKLNQSISKVLHWTRAELRNSDGEQGQVLEIIEPNELRDILGTKATPIAVKLYFYEGCSYAVELEYLSDSIPRARLVSLGVPIDPAAEGCWSISESIELSYQLSKSNESGGNSLHFVYIPLRDYLGRYYYDYIGEGCPVLEKRRSFGRSH